MVMKTGNHLTRIFTKPHLYRALYPHFPSFSSNIKEIISYIRINMFTSNRPIKSMSETFSLQIVYSHIYMYSIVSVLIIHLWSHYLLIPRT